MAVLDGYSWQDTLHLAVGTGALCVGTYDALSGILPLSEVKKRLIKVGKSNKTENEIKEDEKMLVNMNEILYPAQKGDMG